ncbi:glutamine--fructose-6-phosphate transaminase (isomerizing) [Fusobacterium gastrosuis]|uniref:glutamine--fructose-6-phosphate transaminase (isomerizing) n=1 Tax=Fusobacterium gastrosuis TaxID=1755100 RepID=UPI0029777E3B|nr:glutamine--fructose-6-phosphate transaminase (isomerizing) [Fusobacteriaceae bacterium]MDY5713876.1 glutamine--fructose-6-phosphate transaminase (isomerizing) [Fusobacterium gastrosuis]
MCGIIGYSGSEADAINVILEGLEKLEYRGYDSAGIAFLDGNKIIIEKKEGKLQNLKEHLKDVVTKSNLGIGHTRWATHGVPTDRNSHPHYSENKDVVLVHNGIIENYQELKNELLASGVKFSSDTDSEVVAQLFSKLFDGDLLSTLNKVIEKIRGSYALAIIHKDFPNKMICCKNHSPLIVGLGAKQNFVASDVSAVLKYTKDVIFLEDGDKVIVEQDRVEIFDKDNKSIERKINKIEWNFEQATKGGYEHFMIKEIEEQPEIIEKTLNVYTDKNFDIKFDEQLEGINFQNIDRIYIVACGTAYYAGLQGQYFMKKILGIDIFTDIASEFRYNEPIITDRTLAIFVSQSGETFDTLMSMKYAKEKGAKTLAISNVLGSTLTREADNVIYTLAGPEISVASTKAYSSQVLVLYLLSLYIGLKFEKIQEKEYVSLIKDITKLKANIEKIIENKNTIYEIAKIIKDTQNGFYLGRGIDEKIAREGSLKMKEINYIHTESLPAGELKHGSIALIENGVLVVVISTDLEMDEKTVSNIKEVKARGAYVVGVAKKGSLVSEAADKYIEIEDSGLLLTPLTAAIALQYLAYYTAYAKGYDMDKPRNLAKSVTVE